MGCLLPERLRRLLFYFNPQLSSITRRRINPFQSDFHLGNKEDFIKGSVADFKKQVNFFFDERDGQFKVKGVYNDPLKPYDFMAIKFTDEICILRDDPIFKDLLRISINMERPIKLKNALSRFFATLEK